MIRETPDEVKSLWSAQLQEWNTNQPYVRVPRDPHPEIPGKLERIETPDKANAFYYSSQQYVLSDEDQEYALLVLGNFILGGGTLSSRLGDRVRQQEGLSYTVRSSVSARERDQRVDFLLYAIANPENTDRLIEVIREELDRLRKDGVTEDELEKAKVAYLQNNRVRRADDGSLAAELLGTIFNERTMQYQADHEAQIEAATIDSVNAVIRKFIAPDKLVSAAAGDFAAAAKKTDDK